MVDEGNRHRVQQWQSILPVTIGTLLRCNPLPPGVHCWLYPWHTTAMCNPLAASAWVTLSTHDKGLARVDPFLCWWLILCWWLLSLMVTPSSVGVSFICWSLIDLQCCLISDGDSQNSDGAPPHAHTVWLVTQPACLYLMFFIFLLLQCVFQSLTTASCLAPDVFCCLMANTQVCPMASSVMLWHSSSPYGLLRGHFMQSPQLLASSSASWLILSQSAL